MLIKPLTTKAYDRRAFGDCGTSGVDLRNHCNIFWVDGGIHPKNGGKTASSCAQVFPPFMVWMPPSTQKCYNDSLSFYFGAFNR